MDSNVLCCVVLFCVVLCCIELDKKPFSVGISVSQLNIIEHIFPAEALLVAAFIASLPVPYILISSHAEQLSKIIYIYVYASTHDYLFTIDSIRIRVKHLEQPKRQAWQMHFPNQDYKSGCG